MTAPQPRRGSRAAARRRRRQLNRLCTASALAIGAALILIGAHGGGSTRPTGQVLRSATLPAAAPQATTVAPATAAADRPAAPTGRTATPRQPWTVLALGDSVPAGTACGCTPFPTLYAADVAEMSGRSTTSLNLAKPGLTSAGLLAQLAPGTAAFARIAQASVITVTIGANDFAYESASQCPALACYASRLAAMQANVGAILQRVAAGRGNRPTAVLVLGYWEVWEDGQVGDGQGSDYMTVNNALTAAVNRGLAAAAAAATATYVDLQAAFHRSPGEDDTDLLAADGDHPNAAGHIAIAQTLRSVGLPSTLRPDGA